MIQARDGRLNALQRALVDTFMPIIGDITDAVVVGYPAHGNAGDSLIWLAQLGLLERLGIEVRAITTPGRSLQRILRRMPTQVAVVLSGGGNFGDLWPRVQLDREATVRAATGRRVIQLPQSLWFGDKNKIPAARRVLSEHGEVVLSWRDSRSYDAAREIFPDSPSLLAPDVAFMLRPTCVPLEPTIPILCIARTDQESGGLRYTRVSDGRLTDWNWHGHPASHLVARAVWRVIALERRVGPTMGQRLRLAMCNKVAGMTVERAKEVVSSGEIVVSDRLHAHVLCMMLGVPHVMVDTRFGKISALVETWTAESELVHLAKSAREGVNLARELARLA